jgi:hypothetical protein
MGHRLSCILRVYIHRETCSISFVGSKANPSRRWVHTLKIKTSETAKLAGYEVSSTPGYSQSAITHDLHRHEAVLSLLVDVYVATAAGHGDTQTEWRVSSGGQAHQRRDAVRQEEAGAKVVERLSIILATGVVYIHSGCSGP